MKKILVVEDDPKLFKLLEWRLESLGIYKAINAEDGIDGLNMAKTEKPDLIILDLMLPLMDGFEVCKNLKSDDATKGIPVIILTSMTMVGDMEKGLSAGADDYVTKPYNFEQLLKKIEKYLGKPDKQEG
ncbi:MAG: response regulator [Candidatus Omnitrophota bacterium]